MKRLNHIIGVSEAARILKLTPGTVKNYCAQGKLEGKKIGKTWILDKENLQIKGDGDMKTWKREGYQVVEKAFDGDLHEFDVIVNDEVVGTITPGDIEDMEQIITDLDNGEDVDGWEDGMGGNISIPED